MSVDESAVLGFIPCIVLASSVPDPSDQYQKLSWMRNLDPYQIIRIRILKNIENLFL